MLLTEEVEVPYGAKTHTYYEELGYYFEKIETKKPILRNRNGKMVRDYQKQIKHLPAIVKIEDLSYGSSVKVECNCDRCDKIMTMCYYTYKKINHNGKTYYQSCANSLFHSGENNARWNFSKTKEERELQRNSSEYFLFCKNVLNRDAYACRCCGSKNDIQVHHLDGYDWCKEKRTEVENGITLCEICHKNFHMIYGKGSNTKEQFEEWFNKTINDLSVKNSKLFVCKIAYCAETKEFIYNIRDYCRKHNLDPSTIYNCCNRNKSLSYKGRHYFWVDELNESNIEEDAIKLAKEIEDRKIKTMHQQRKYSAKVRSKEVIQLTKDNDFVRKYESLCDVKQYGYNVGAVSNCCNKLKNHKTHKGYRWVFAEEYYNDI